MNDEARRKAIFAAVYTRLRDAVVSQLVSGERVRAAALEALANARMDVEIGRKDVADLIDRLKDDAASATQPSKAQREN